jgi:hypothetical protein
MITMPNLKKWGYFIVSIVVVNYLVDTYLNREVTHGYGIVSPHNPVQSTTKSNPFTLSGLTITPLADFEIEARVLSKENYKHDEGSKISPVDLALGWGKMSDEAILKDIEITQYGRFYYWMVSKYPIPREEIINHSSNVHIIPATDEIKFALNHIRIGHIVNMKGMLVSVSGENGFRWSSSLTRNDSGNGACELFYVNSLIMREN